MNDKKKREKLIIYINPPYAEVSSKKININGEKGKKGVNKTLIQERYLDQLGTASRELYAQFLIRINKELPGAYIANFSTLKNLQGSAFDKFRKNFKPKLNSLFVVPANTFDNVRGDFPIGFFIWDGSKKESFKKITADVYNKDAELTGQKNFHLISKDQYINKWISQYKEKEPIDSIGFMDGINANDFQHNNIVYITNTNKFIPNPRGIWITPRNIFPVAIYLSVRKVFKSTWLNDRDQYIVPSSGWETDPLFQSDCLTYALFNNKILTSFEKNGFVTPLTNQWIPFKEEEVQAKDCFENHFMTDFISGQYSPKTSPIIDNSLIPTTKLTFSAEAREVFATGKKLWQFYHSQKITNPNASLYEIQKFFQNLQSDETAFKKYDELITELRNRIKILSENIKQKAILYGFLKL